VVNTGADKTNDQNLAFMGKIVAGQCHEVVNVLNVINELAGLQQDLLCATDDERNVPRPKLEEIGRKIQIQVARGERIIRNINLFAHCTDAPLVLFDVKEAIDRIVFLAERWTRLKRVELTSELCDETTALENSPFLLQCAIFVCIDAALAAAADKRRVIVSYSVEKDGVEVVVTSADPVPRCIEIMSSLASLRALVENLGGELRALPNDRGDDRFVFFVSNCARRSTGGDSVVAEEV